MTEFADPSWRNVQIQGAANLYFLTTFYTARVEDYAAVNRESGQLCPPINAKS